MGIPLTESEYNKSVVFVVDDALDYLPLQDNLWVPPIYVYLIYLSYIFIWSIILYTSTTKI